jgi:hypothetical protein
MKSQIVLKIVNNNNIASHLFPIRCAWYEHYYQIVWSTNEIGNEYV